MYSDSVVKRERRRLQGSCGLRLFNFTERWKADGGRDGRWMATRAGGCISIDKHRGPWHNKERMGRNGKDSEKRRDGNRAKASAEMGAAAATV